MRQITLNFNWMCHRHQPAILQLDEFYKRTREI